jgi:hypothetical protein
MAPPPPVNFSQIKHWPPDPGFDKECREVKRLTRRLERTFSAANRQAHTAAVAAAPVVSDAAAAVAVAKAAAAKAAWYITSVARTVNYVIGSALHFGATGLKLVSQILRSYGGQWTFCLDVAAYRRVHLLTSRRVVYAVLH